MDVVEKVNTFMAAMSREGDAPERSNLIAALQTIGVHTCADATELFEVIREPSVSNLIKSSADSVHPHITGHISADDISAITCNAIAAVLRMPEWVPIQTQAQYSLPKIS